jgi:hypothetical protein
MPFDIVWTIAGDLRVETANDVQPTLIVCFEGWYDYSHRAKLVLLQTVVEQALADPALADIETPPDVVE